VKLKHTRGRALPNEKVDAQRRVQASSHSLG
jgi:hypothetical protein